MLFFAVVIRFFWQYLCCRAGVRVTAPSALTLPGSRVADHPIDDPPHYARQKNANNNCRFHPNL